MRLCQLTSATAYCYVVDTRRSIGGRGDKGATGEDRPNMGVALALRTGGAWMEKL
jgi:hypothetical protein